MRVRSGLGLMAAASLGLSLAATPAMAAPGASLGGTGTVYLWPEFSSEETLAADMDSLADLVEALAPQAGVADSVAQGLATQMREHPEDVLDAWFTDEPAAVAGELRADSTSISARVTVLQDGNLGVGLVQLGPVTAQSAVVTLGGVQVDFFPMLHTAATEMVENAAPADLARMPEVTPMSIGGCTALPNSGGWVRRADCTVYGSRTPPTASASILISYSVKSGGGRIDGTPSQLETRCALGAATNKSMVIIRRLNNGSVPARVDYTFDCLRVLPTTPARLSFYAYGSAWDSFH